MQHTNISTDRAVFLGVDELESLDAPDASDGSFESAAPAASATPPWTWNGVAQDTVTGAEGFGNVLSGGQTFQQGVNAGNQLQEAQGAATAAKGFGQLGQVATDIWNQLPGATS